MGQGLMPVGSFTSPNSGSRVDAYWDASSNQLVLASPEGNTRMDSIGSLEDTLEYLRQRGVVLN